MNDFERVRDAISFIDYAARYVTIKAHKALCIFHSDTHASMHIYQDGFKCFSCNTSGDIFDFAMKLHGWSRQEALMELAREANIQLTPLLPHNKEKHEHRERLYAVMGKAQQFYQEQLFNQWGGFALRYLIQDRGLSEETIKSAGLGFATSEGGMFDRLHSAGFTMAEIVNSGICGETKKETIFDRFRFRIVIPYRDAKGRVVAFTGRAIDKGQTPKYLHNPTTDIFEKSKIIHRMPLSDTTRGVGATNTLVIVEGSIDPVSALNRGFFNVVSQMGSSLTSEQLALLCKNGTQRLIFCLDNDAAGISATERLVKEHAHAAADRGVDLYVMTCPFGKDPDDTFREHSELWQPAVDAARPAIDVLIEMSIGALPQNATAGDKQRLALKLLPLLKGSNAILQETSFQALASALSIPVDVLRSWADKQPDLRVIKTPHPVSIRPAAPTDEYWILYAILMDESWLGRVNHSMVMSSLSLTYGDWMLKAFAMLMPADFTDPSCRRLMVMIYGAMERNLPIADTLADEMEDPLREIYERVLHADEWAALLNLSIDTSEASFIERVLRLRIARLMRDSEPYKTADIETWLHYQDAITCLEGIMSHA